VILEKRPDRLFHAVGTIALQLVEKAVCDQAVKIGRAYLDLIHTKPTLTAVPETRHSNGAGACAGFALDRWAERLQAAV